MSRSFLRPELPGSAYIVDLILFGMVSMWRFVGVERQPRGELLFSQLTLQRFYMLAVEKRIAALEASASDDSMKIIVMEEGEI